MLNLPKFTFLSGPPLSGKTTLADLLMKQEEGLWQESFSQPVRDMIYAVFYPEEGPISFSFDLRHGVDKRREMPYKHDFKSPISIEAAMLSFSENWMKSGFGNDIFGRLALARCREQEAFYSSFVIDDANDLPAMEYIVSQVGWENCHLIRLHRLGCQPWSDFHLPRVQTLDLRNKGQPQEMLDLLALEMGIL